MDHEKYLRRCIEISEESVASGNNPFGALLVDKEGNILIESGNIEVTEKDITGHAETTVAKLAGKNILRSFYGKLRYIQRQSLAVCVPVPFIGPT